MVGQISDDEPAPGALTWMDVFPWLRSGAYAGYWATEANWRGRPIDSTSAADRRRIVTEIARMALEELNTWKIGEVFPTLPSALPLKSLPFNNRALHVLAREQLEVAADLQEMRPGDLLDLKSLGVGTVDLILQVLAEEAARSPFTSELAYTTGLSYAPSGVAPVDDYGPLVGPFRDLLTIARWQVAIGTDSRPLLAPTGPEAPPSIIEAWRRLAVLSAGDVVSHSDGRIDAAAILQSAIAGLEDREQLILRKRFFAAKEETLDSLGERLDLTRERVRQLESRARTELGQLVAPGAALQLVVESARLLIGNLLPLDALLTAMPALGRPVENADQPAWRVLDRLDDSYEIRDGWCAVPTVAGAMAETIARLQELANPYGVVALEDFGPLNAALSPDRHGQVLRDWLLHCGVTLHGDYALTQTQSIGDRACAVLSVVGTPLSAIEILERIGVDRSLTSLKNAMGVDDRIERVDRDRWALVEWGLDAYNGIRAVIRDELYRAGGQVQLDALVEHITAKYSVSANSVMAYASGPPFEAVGGVVRLSSGPGAHRKTPQETRHLYRRQNHWLYRVTISNEHLRGSGTVAPIALAGVIGLDHGESRSLRSPDGPQIVTWTGLQPTFGSIRRLLILADIAADTEVFLVIGDDQTFDIELVADLAGDPLSDALALVGVAPAPDSIGGCRRHLASAIGLDDNVSLADLYGAYRGRGDSDVAELLTTCRQLADQQPRFGAVAAPDIEEILELL